MDHYEMKIANLEEEIERLEGENGKLVAENIRVTKAFKGQIDKKT